MKKSFLLCVMMCVFALTDTFAQKHQSLITNDMAHKIAWASQYGKRDFRARLFGDFCNANEITSSLEYDRIMENITKHKDKVENFCRLVINTWGNGDFGYAYFKNMDFTVAEFDIVVKIYNQWAETIRKKQREEEKMKEEEAKRIKAQQIAQDRDTLAAWSQRGKPVFPIFLYRETDHTVSNPVKAPTFVTAIEGYGWGEVVTSEMQFKTDSPNNKRSSSHTKRYNGGFEQTELVTIDTVFYFTIDDNRKNIPNNTRYWKLGSDWVWQVDLDSTSHLFDYIDCINIAAPGTYTFYGIDSTINIPTRNALRIVETRNRIQWDGQYNSFFDITLNWDNKTHQWKIAKYDENILRKWYNSSSLNMGWYLNVNNADSFINILTMQINDEMNGVDGKKCRLKIEIIGGGERKYYINGYKLEDSNGLPFRTKILNMEKIK